LKNAIIITGMPGTGKTYLAMNLGVALMKQGNSAIVLHTDLLKVTLRVFQTGLEGAGYSGNFWEKARLVRPFLEQQVNKAEKDGYILIIEGTLALGFSQENTTDILLELPEDVRRDRVKQKHNSAQKTLHQELKSLEQYRQALIASVSPKTLRLDATNSIEILVERILYHLVL